MALTPTATDAGQRKIPRVSAFSFAAFAYATGLTDSRPVRKPGKRADEKKYRRSETAAMPVRSRELKDTEEMAVNQRTINVQANLVRPAYRRACVNLNKLRKRLRREIKERQAADARRAVAA